MRLFRRKHKPTAADLLAAIAAIGRQSIDAESIARAADNACLAAYFRGWHDGTFGLPQDPFVGNEVREALNATPLA